MLAAPLQLSMQQIAWSDLETCWLAVSFIDGRLDTASRHLHTYSNCPKQTAHILLALAHLWAIQLVKDTVVYMCPGICRECLSVNSSKACLDVMPW